MHTSVHVEHPYRAQSRVPQQITSSCSASCLPQYFQISPEDIQSYIELNSFAEDAVSNITKISKNPKGHKIDDSLKILEESDTKQKRKIDK